MIWRSILHNRRRWVLAAAIILFITVVTLVYSTKFWIKPFFSDEPLQAVNGIFEVQEPFTDDKVLPLTGQWRFYPNTFVPPEQIDWDAAAPTGLTIPGGGWDHALGSPFGQGTYALEIQMPRAEQMVSLKTLSIRMAYRLYVNNELVDHSGTLSDEGQSRPENYPRRSYIDVDSSLIRVVIQVENQIYGEKGGIIAPILIGSPLAMDHYSFVATGFDMFRTLSYLLGGIMFFCFYFMWPTRKYPLYIGGHLLALALFAMTHGEKVLGHWIPGIRYEWFLMLQLLSVLVGIYTISVYVHKLFPSRSGARLLRIITYSCVVLALFGILLPYSFISRYDSVFGIPMLIAYCHGAYRFWLAAYQKRDSALLCFITSLHFIILFVNQSLSINGLLSNNAFPPWDAITFMLLQLLLIGKRFANVSKRTEQLSRKIVEVSEAKQVFIRQNAYRLQEPLYKADKLIELVLEQTLEQTQQPASRHDTTRNSLENARMLILQQLDHVHDLVDWVDLRDGKSAERFPMLVNECLRSVFRNLSYMPECKGVELKQELEMDFHVALGDESRFRHVVRKLVVASVKPGSIVLASAERLPHAQLVLRLTIVNPALPAEEASGWMQLDVDQTASYQSRAMHLIMAYQWMKQLAGELSAFQPEASSDLVYELVFRSVRPDGEQPMPWPSAGDGEGRDEQELLANSESAAAQEPFQQQARIMIITKDEVNRDIVTAILSGQAYEMLHCTSTHAALRQLMRHELPDLILCDQLVEGQSGIELCAQIRRSYSSAVLPFLLIVSPLEPQERLAAFRADVNDIVVFPFEASELRSRVRNIISMKQSMENAVQMEQAFLQAQIKPHFLYNAMNSILSLSYSDVAKARQVIFDLSAYLRYSFDFGNTKRSVPLQQELELVEAYLNIESVRFGSRLRYELDWDERIAAQIPPLTLQPIVENAVRHGIAPSVSGGSILVSIRKTGEHVIAVIADDGAGIDEQRLAQIRKDDLQGGHVGLLNIRKRLNRLSAVMTIESRLGEGTRVTLTLPIRKGESA